jgi:hypothetical protein
MLNISEVFEAIQDKFLPEELNGEFILQGNCIIWTYDLDEDSEVIPAPSEDDEESNYSFESQSSEELLWEAYQEDLEAVELFLDSIGEENWTFGDPDIGDSTISFKIF